MYAVIETGGKQYHVEVGTELAVELLDVEPGQEITLDRVLLVADGDEAAIGRPLVAGAVVSATVLRADRADKVISFKYKPKARRRVKKGHRQEQTILRITDVALNGKSAAATEKRAAEARKTERERLAEAAATQAPSPRPLRRRPRPPKQPPKQPLAPRTRRRRLPPRTRRRSRRRSRFARGVRRWRRPQPTRRSPQPTRRSPPPSALAPRRRKTDRWPTRKQAPARRTAATRSASGWA
jgi:large subunit ribosomal protein L21